MNLFTRTFKRSFITLERGSVIGKINNFGNYGIVFKNPFVIVKLSPVLLERKFFHNTEEHNNILTHAILYQKNVKIDYEHHLFGFPWKGEIIEPIYIKKIEIFDDN